MPAASPHYRFGDLLALARLSWVRQLRTRMEEAGFADYRRSDAGIVRLLAVQPCAIGQLGGALSVTRQAARQLADGLVGRGYASYAADPADARRTLVVLTARGEQYAAAVWCALDALNQAVYRQVGTADLAAADRVLRAVFAGDAETGQVAQRLPPPGPSPASLPSAETGPRRRCDNLRARRSLTPRGAATTPRSLVLRR